MEKEIRKVLDNYNVNEYEAEKITNELLDLNFVSHKRELLESFREKWNESRFVSDGIYKSDIDDFLEDLNEDNCG